MLNEVYIVAWTGGYERPQYKATATSDEAIALGNEWAEEAKDGDQIDAIKVDLADPVEGLKAVRIFDFYNGEQFGPD